MNLNDEHHIRARLRIQRERLVAASGGSEYYARIDMAFTEEKLQWTASLGSSYNDTLSMKGEVLEELVTLLIETYTRKNNIKLCELEAPGAGA